jgi:plasmid stability protein
MASLTIRNLDDALKTRLRVRAAEHGHSMEEEVRMLLRTHLPPDKPAKGGLDSDIHALFAPLGGVDLPDIEGDFAVSTVDFD